MAEQPDNNRDASTRRRLTAEDLRQREQRLEAIRHRDNLAASRKQVDRVIGDLQADFLARYPWGYGRVDIAHKAMRQIATSRTLAGRDLSDAEARALAETAQASISASGQIKWVSAAGALYFWNKGRAIGRYPFPAHHFRIASSSPRAQAVRLMAYWIVADVVSAPVRFVVGFMAEHRAMKERLPALGPLMAELRQKENQGAGEAQNMAQSAGQLWDNVLEQKRDDQPSEADPASYPSNYESSAQSTTQPAYEPPATYAQRQNASSSWGSSDLDIDDASPVASEASQPSNTWARLRQQSHAGQTQQSQQGSQTHNAWQRQRQQAKASEEWDPASAGRSPEARGPRESVSFGSADPERDSAREQAQREFDAMLDRERQGSDAGGSARRGRGSNW